MIDTTKTFKDLIVGDIIYEVDLCGSIEEHQITRINSTDYGIGIEWDTNGYQIPKRDITSYGYAGFFTVYNRAVKLANSRQKHDLKHQIEYYKLQIRKSEQAIKKFKNKLKSIEKELYKYNE